MPLWNGKPLLNLVYPVGSIYWSSNNTNPGTLFGGTWTQIKDKFILAAGDYYSNEATGGAATVTLTVSNMPSHSHSFTPSGTVGSHTHTGPSHTHSFTPNGSVSSTFTGTSGTTGETKPTFKGEKGTVNVTGGNHRHEMVHDGTKGDEADVFECYNGMSYYYRGAHTQYSGDLSMSGEFTPSGSVGSHAHSFTPSGSVSSTFTGTSGTTGAAGTGNTGSTAPSFTGTAGTTGSNGSGSSFSILPPYIVKYCWERTA